MINKNLYWIWLSQINGVCPITCKRLLNKSKLPENIYRASKEDLKNIEGIRGSIVSKMLNNKDLDISKKIIEKCYKNNIDIISMYNDNFPKRNKLTSAIYEKILIVESREKSGALITDKYAREQNKKILVAPNNIYSIESKGSNRLISEGEKMILNLLYNTPRTLDSLISVSKLSGD